MKKLKIKFSSDSLLAISLLAALMISIFPVSRIHGHLSLSQSNYNLGKVDFINCISHDGFDVPIQSQGNQIKIKSDSCSLCDFIFNSNYIGSGNTVYNQIPPGERPDYVPEEESIPFSKILNCFNKGSPNIC